MSMRYAAVCLLAVFATGCGIVPAVQDLGSYMKSRLKPRHADYTMGAEEESDAWVEDNLTVARETRHVTKDPDPWWKEYFMSEKARSIERNVGID